MRFYISQLANFKQRTIDSYSLNSYYIIPVLAVIVHVLAIRNEAHK